MIEIGIIVIVFIIGFGLTKWLSEKFEQRDFKLKPLYQVKNEERDEEK